MVEDNLGMMKIGVEVEEEGEEEVEEMINMEAVRLIREKVEEEEEVDTRREEKGLNKIQILIIDYTT